MNPSESVLATRETILVLTRLAIDGQAIARHLAPTGIPVSLHSDIESFCRLLPDCQVAILTIEALHLSQIQMIKEALTNQPPWSDVPIILLTGRASPAVLQEYLSDLGNITVLERPLQPSSLISVVRSAVRARRKQWEGQSLLLHNAALNEQLQRAMTETHHRVKNNLQLVAAMVDLMAMEDRPASSREELHHLSTHIRGLAVIHDILTEDTKARKEGTVLSAKAVLEKLLPLIKQTVSGRQIHYQITDTQLPTRHCTSLAIITNELVSNALKYSTTDISVGFMVESDTAHLRVEDNGSGFPDGFDPIRDGNTGLNLVMNLSEHDLSGQVLFNNREQGGGQIILSFPLASA